MELSKLGSLHFTVKVSVIYWETAGLGEVAVTGSWGLSAHWRHILSLVIPAYGTSNLTPGPLTGAGSFVGGDGVWRARVWSASGPCLVSPVLEQVILSQAGDMMPDRGAEQWWAVRPWIAQHHWCPLLSFRIAYIWNCDIICYLYFLYWLVGTV